MLNKKKKVNVNPNLKGELFFSNQVDFRVFPDSLKIDFKQLNPVTDKFGGDKHESLIINRQSILMTPVMLKRFVNTINEVLSKIESKQGEIKLPPKPKKTEKKKVVKDEVISTGYIG